MRGSRRVARGAVVGGIDVDDEFSRIGLGPAVEHPPRQVGRVPVTCLEEPLVGVCERSVGCLPVLGRPADHLLGALCADREDNAVLTS